MSSPREEPTWLPKPDEITLAPELALLASLRITLDVLRMAMMAANPELHNEWPPEHPPLAKQARQVLVRAFDLARAIDRYRRLAEPPSPSDLDDRLF